MHYCIFTISDSSCVTPSTDPAAGERVTNILTILLWSWGRGRHRAKRTMMCLLHGHNLTTWAGEEEPYSWNSFEMQLSSSFPAKVLQHPFSDSSTPFGQSPPSSPTFPACHLIVLERKSLFMFVVFGGKQQQQQQQCHKLNETQEFMAFHCQRRRIPVPCHH